MSYRSHKDDITISRHRQFVSVIEEQISHVETELKESFEVEGKKPFRWVNLDEEECDDLALFLSGTSGTSQKITDEGAALREVVDNKNNTNEDSNLDSEISSNIKTPSRGKNLEEVVMINEGVNCIPEQDGSRFPEMGDGISYQADKIASNRRIWSPPERSALEIVIDKDDRQTNTLTEATRKEKGSRPFFWSSKGEDRVGAKGGALSHSQLKMISWINQVLTLIKAMITSIRARCIFIIILFNTLFCCFVSVPTIHPTEMNIDVVVLTIKLPISHKT